MQINENVNMYATVMVKVEDHDVQVLNISSNVTQNGTSFNVNVNVINSEQVALNATLVQEQINLFLDNLRTKLVQSNYKIVI